MMESIRNLHIVLFFWVMCVGQTIALDCPYSDPKCTCTSNTVTCNDLEQIPPLNTGDTVIQVSILYFLRGNITSIPSNSLPPNLTLISLYRHPVTTISEDAFDTSAATLVTLLFSGASFNSLPTAVRKLTTLKHLHIEDTMIQNWDTALVKHIAATLNRLTLINVGLSTWPGWIFDFHLLSALTISRNSLFSIPNNAFSSLEDSLRFLDLSSTGLTHVPNALSRLSTLFSLNLNKNNLTDVPTGLLPTSLTSLYLQHNYLTSVPNDVANISRLSILYMDNNRISDIEANSFPLSLINLGLNWNNLNIIKNTTFRNLTYLKNLYLDYNPITTISPEAFSDLVSLQDLHITNSQLIEIPLAFTRLNNTRLDIWFSTTQDLACPCPVSPDLVQWFTLVPNGVHVYSTCSNGDSVTSYLRGQCDRS